MRKDEILKALNDLDIKENDIERIINYYDSKQFDKCKSILQTYRLNILEQLHFRQDKLYSLDFLIKEIEKIRRLYYYGIK